MNRLEDFTDAELCEELARRHANDPTAIKAMLRVSFDRRSATNSEAQRVMTAHRASRTR